MPTAELPTLESAHAMEAVPGYQLVRLMGEGTIARAYECRHERTGDIVVLKVIKQEMATGDRGATQRTLRENRVVSGLRAHAHIARVIDVGESAAGPYVAFEKLKGTDLRTMLVQHGRLAVPDALAAVRDAARALEAAANVGVAHRDVKPSNLFRLDAPGPGEGAVKLTDFGFAPPLSRLGGPVGIYGTPAFIAPELLKGAPADVRTDIYALGATLFQLVTARPLFEGATAEVLAAHQKKPVPSIATLVPDAGIAVVDVIYRLLHKDPGKRPQTPGDVVALLEEAMGKKRTTSSVAMPGVGGVGGVGGAAPSARPAPSEPQWPTMASPAGSALPRPPTRPGLPAVGSMTHPAPSSSPFDAPSGEESNPYTAQPTGVLGTLKQMGVTDILQMLEIGKKSARLDVNVEGANAVIQVHDGQIVFARIARPGASVEADGERAVMLLCRKKEGFFRIHYEKENTERNVNKPTQFVLLEAMRQIDENALEDAPAPSVNVSSTSSGAPRAPLPSLATPLGRAAPPGPGAAAGFQSPANTWPESPPAKHERAKGNLGDGIQRDEPTQAVETIDDPTMPEAPTSKGRRAPAFDFGRVLARVSAQLAGGATRIGRHAFDVGNGLYRRAQHALEPLRPKLAGLHPRLATVPPVVLAAGALAFGFALVIVVVTLITSWSALGYEDGVEAIFDGGARASAGDIVEAAADIVDELEDIAPSERTLDQDLLLGHAHAALRQDERALELYRIALPVRADVIALGVLASRLDATAPDEEIDLLVLWPDDDADALLAELTLDPRPLVRMNAAAILVERGSAGLMDVEQTAKLDLVQARSCGERRIALATLRAAGKSAATLALVDRIGREHETCFGTNELRSAYAAIQRRLPAVKD